MRTGSMEEKCLITASAKGCSDSFSIAAKTDDFELSSLSQNISVTSGFPS